MDLNMEFVSLEGRNVKHLTKGIQKSSEHMFCILPNFNFENVIQKFYACSDFLARRKEKKGASKDIYVNCRVFSEAMH